MVHQNNFPSKLTFDTFSNKTHSPSTRYKRKKFIFFGQWDRKCQLAEPKTYLISVKHKAGTISNFIKYSLTFFKKMNETEFLSGNFNSVFFEKKIKTT